MKSIREKLVALWKDEEGMEMVEYAIVGGLIVAVGAAVFITLGTNIAAVIGKLAADVGLA